MYTLIRTIPVSRLLIEQLPAAGGALIIAEAFYKFHSFTLECVAFLATWFGFELLLSTLRSWRDGNTAQDR
jgi:hypothetical protein